MQSLSKSKLFQYIRCLEEGAEEFFLKPMRLSDVNRLKPHMLRAKYGKQQQQLLEDCQKPEPIPVDQPPPPPPPQQEQEQEPKQQKEELHKIQQEQPQQTQVQVHQQQNNSKRKSMGDGLSPDRTRPRYNDLTTVV